MKTAAISTIAISLLATLSTAFPALPNLALKNKPRSIQYINVEFQAAANTGYSQVFPVDGSVQYISNDPDDLSISHIVLDGYAPCTFYGVDGSVTSLSSGGIDVGPPQTQVYGICG
jgi:hypothetical protein